MQVIAHNMLSQFTERQLNITDKNKSKSTEKLSSGYRINRAGDDAAGLAISLATILLKISLWKEIPVEITWVNQLKTTQKNALLLCEGQPQFIQCQVIQAHLSEIALRLRLAR